MQRIYILNDDRSRAIGMVEAPSGSGSLRYKGAKQVPVAGAIRSNGQDPRHVRLLPWSVSRSYARRRDSLLRGSFCVNQALDTMTQSYGNLMFCLPPLTMNLDCPDTLRTPDHFSMTSGYRVFRPIIGGFGYDAAQVAWDGLELVYWLSNANRQEYVRQACRPDKALVAMQEWAQRQLQAGYHQELRPSATPVITDPSAVPAVVCGSGSASPLGQWFF